MNSCSVPTVALHRSDHVPLRLEHDWLPLQFFNQGILVLVGVIFPLDLADGSCLGFRGPVCQLQ